MKKWKYWNLSSNAEIESVRVGYMELEMFSGNEWTDLHRPDGLQDEASRDGDSGVTVYNKG